MELFDYLMAKKGKNTGKDLFSYLLGKNAGGSGTYTTFSGITLNISNTVFGRIKNFMLNSTELAQDGTPTPSSPVDVNVIKGDNTITISNSDNTEEQNYPISLASKNLFNPNTITLNKYISGMDGVLYDSASSNASDFISINGGQNYTFSFDYETLASSNERAICFYKEDKSYITYTTYDFTEKHTTITPPSNAKYVRFTLDKNMTDIQLEIGSTPTTFEKYYNIEYCKIGDYADQIFKNTTDSPFYDNTLIENEWYLKKNIDKFTFDGSESWYGYRGSQSQYTHRVMAVNNRIVANKDCLMVSDRFVESESAVLNANADGVYCYSNNVMYIAVAKSLLPGNEPADFKQWLSENHTTVYYQRSAPTFTQISQENYSTLKAQLEDIYNNSKSYNGQTNITQTNDDLPFNISVDVLIKN